jgi:hypothetical protein
MKDLEIVSNDKLLDKLFLEIDPEIDHENFYLLRNQELAIIFQRLLCAKEFAIFNELYTYPMSKHRQKSSIRIAFPFIIDYAIIHDEYDIITYLEKNCTLWVSDYSYEIMMSLIKCV